MNNLQKKFFLNAGITWKIYEPFNTDLNISATGTYSYNGWTIKSVRGTYQGGSSISGGNLTFGYAAANGSYADSWSQMYREGAKLTADYDIHYRTISHDGGSVWGNMVFSIFGNPDGCAKGAVIGYDNYSSHYNTFYGVNVMSNTADGVTVWNGSTKLGSVGSISSNTWYDIFIKIRGSKYSVAYNTTGEKPTSYTVYTIPKASINVLSDKFILGGMAGSYGDNFGASGHSYPSLDNVMIKRIR